ncbi:MAG: hypothetical protein R3Y04_05880 [Rikenellaceae bacterium]
MKDIAENIGLTPSVLSAIYSTVLPAYIKSLNDGQEHDNAIDYALSLVNNVSKRRLLVDLDKIHSHIEHYKEAAIIEKSEVPFISKLISEINHNASISGKLDGIYLSYSHSSSACAMKVEPYLLRSSENGANLTVSRINTSGSVHHGFAIIKEHQALYMLFNESHKDSFTMVSVMLQLTLVERVQIIKGLYMCLDVAGNPIARRIVLHKISDSNAMEDFLQTPSRLVAQEELTSDEQLFYDYTCTPTDSLHMCSLPTLTFDKDDLAREKEILQIISRRK